MSAVSIPSRKMPWQTKAEHGTFLAALAIKKEIVKARLVQIREDVGHPDKPGKPLTVEDAAAKAGVKYRTWQRWEAGESVPYARNLAAIADAFEFDVREFYDDSGDKRPTPDPFPPAAIEGDLAEILREIKDEQRAIKAQLAEQNKVLDDIKQYAKRVDTMLTDMRNLKDETETFQRLTREIVSGQRPEASPPKTPRAPRQTAAAAKSPATPQRTP